MRLVRRASIPIVDRPRRLDFKKYILIEGMEMRQGKKEKENKRTRIRRWEPKARYGGRRGGGSRQGSRRV